LVEQLHHAQKMEAMGKLAASIAHEFGNPLLGIRFALRDMQQRPELTTEDTTLLLLAENECDRMRKLIRDLQQFNRPSSGRKTEFDLHRVLDEILALQHNLLAKKNILVVQEYTTQPVRLHAVEDQIRQVLINLVINASDAMSTGGGTLTLSTQVLNGELVLRVQDTGSGIAKEHLDKIFEPFFTTKSAVEGTGLGLPVSYGIVRAHGGQIEVMSEPGNTRFTIFLPCR
jgi:signal transduction histidine kinase